MSILRVHKKAITERDAQKLLEATYRIPNPFGFRVHHIANENFYTDDETAIKTLCDVFKASTEEQVGLPVENSNIFRPFVENDSSLRDRYSQNVHQGAFLKETRMELATINGDAEVFTRFIVGLPENITVKEFLGGYVKKELDTPENRILLRYFTAWHENAHLTGCLEPQADAIGAIMSRQAFENTASLRIMADARMIETLQENPDIWKKYGWQTTEALDFIINLDQATIDSLREDEIWEIALMDFNNRKEETAEAVSTLLHVYHDEHPEEGDEISIAKLAKVSARVLKAKFFEAGSLEQSFLTRMDIALQRSANAELYNDEYLQSLTTKDLKTFPTDVPEFLPTPSSLSPA